MLNTIAGSKSLGNFSVIGNPKDLIAVSSPYSNLNILHSKSQFSKNLYCGKE